MFLRYVRKLKADTEEAQKRWDLCNKCPDLKGIRNPRCSKCGCFMKFKVHVALANCPLGKW